MLRRRPSLGGESSDKVKTWPCMSWRGRGRAPDGEPQRPIPAQLHLHHPGPWASLSGLRVSLWLRPCWLPLPSHPPPPTLAKLCIKNDLRVLELLERPHKCKALLASLLLNINNDISIVHYKPEKKPKTSVEMAKRIIRPSGPQAPSGPHATLGRQMWVGY